MALPSFDNKGKEGCKVEAGEEEEGEGEDEVVVEEEEEEAGGELPFLRSAWPPNEGASTFSPLPLPFAAAAPSPSPRPPPPLDAAGVAKGATLPAAAPDPPLVADSPSTSYNCLHTRSLQDKGGSLMSAAK